MSEIADALTDINTQRWALQPGTEVAKAQQALLEAEEAFIADLQAVAADERLTDLGKAEKRRAVVEEHVPRLRELRDRELEVIDATDKGIREAVDLGYRRARAEAPDDASEKLAFEQASANVARGLEGAGTDELTHVLEAAIAEGDKSTEAAIRREAIRQARQSGSDWLPASAGSPPEIRQAAGFLDRYTGGHPQELSASLRGLLTRLDQAERDRFGRHEKAALEALDEGNARARPVGLTRLRHAFDLTDQAALGLTSVVYPEEKRDEAPMPRVSDDGRRVSF